MVVVVVNGIYINSLLSPLPHPDIAHGLEVVVNSFSKKNAQISILITDVTLITTQESHFLNVGL